MRFHRELGGLGEFNARLGVAPPDRVCLAGAIKALDCELADRLQHPEAVALADADEALVDERLERVHIGIANPLARVDRGPAAEDGKPGKEALLVLVE